MNNILVSIIVPIFNSSLYLDRCIKSLINQTLENIEILLINDGSTDDSLEKCINYENKYENIKVYSQGHSGQGAARNNGLLRANGKYVGFVDSDDYIALNMYEYMFALAEENNADIVSCSYKRVHNHDYIEEQLEVNKDIIILNNKQDIIRDFLTYELTPSPCDKIFQKELLVSNNIKFPECSSYEDIYMILKCIYHSNKIVKNKSAFYSYFERVGSTTTTSSEQNLYNLYKQVTNCYKFINDNFNIEDIAIELRGAKFVHTYMFLKIIRELKKEDEIKCFFKRLPQNIIIFGASAAGQLISYFCNLFDINVLYFCDNNETKWGKRLEDIQIISPNELLSLNNINYKVYIASMHYKEIFEQLCEYMEINKMVDLEIF